MVLSDSRHNQDSIIHGHTPINRIFYDTSKVVIQELYNRKIKGINFKMPWASHSMANSFLRAFSVDRLDKFFRIIDETKIVGEEISLKNIDVCSYVFDPEISGFNEYRANYNVIKSFELNG